MFITGSSLTTLLSKPFHLFATKKTEEPHMINFNKEKLIVAALFFFIFVVFLYFQHFLVDENPLVGDGFQNVTIAKNIVDHFVFSSSDPGVPEPIPDMLREPAWPILTAIFLQSLSLNMPIDSLVSNFNFYFKYLNLTLYALSVSFACCFIYLKTKSTIFSLVGLVLFIIIYGTTPRLINNFNNEALATLLMLLASVLSYELINLKNKRWPVPVALGLLLGLLALTKAQYLYICIPLALVLFFFARKSVLFTIATFAIVVAPWIYRNYVQFNELAIAKRGMTVAAIRVILTSEPTEEEILCMTYAFTHPSLQHRIEKSFGINNSDFMQGGKCQRLNREICFDMGSVKVKCAPFPEDLRSSDYSSKIQLFYKGFSAGLMIENKQLSFSDIFNPNVDFFMKYIKTIPLFAWRGLGFSDYPAVSIVISISVFVLLFTRYWPFPLLCIFSQIFHIALTHNMPRYHAVEFPVLIVSTVLLLYLIIKNSKQFICFKNRCYL